MTKVSPMPRTLSAVLLAPLALFALPGVASAATPRPKAMLEAHKHNTGGHDWHVQVEVNNKSTGLVTVVVYSQECGETGFTQGITLGEDGSFDLVDVPLADKKGTWSLNGEFSDPDHASGTWSMTKGACTSTGPFRAQDATGHFLIGNPYEYAPEGIAGKSLNARRLRKLEYDTNRNAKRFDTIVKAKKQGYELSTATGCPGMHHARKHGTAMWGNVLDATAPQSVVYWCNADKKWTLAAFMYRADGKGKRPPTFGDMVQWHKHGPKAPWMMHIWLVSDPVSAFAACAPFPAFNAAGMFPYEPYTVDASVDNPCSDSAPPQEVAQTDQSDAGA